MTAFEDLPGLGVDESARPGAADGLRSVGSHWSADVQLDVVAINWHDKAILFACSFRNSSTLISHCFFRRVFV
jgi:hypothetical protein